MPMTDKYLTRRQRSIVDGLAKGLTNKEIATACGIAEGTVKGNIYTLFAKYGHRYTRYTFPLLLAREHERDRAIELNTWIERWKEHVPADALVEIKLICQSQVAEFLKEIVPNEKTSA